MKETNKPLRILHLSDIHIHTQLRHMKWHKWFSKRAIGAINLLRGRAKYFDQAQEKMEALIRFKQAQDIDLVIHTGDYTALGLESELKLSKQIVEPLMDPSSAYITVPGNHDIYVSESKSHDRFSHYFNKVLQSDMPQYSSDGNWPLVRLIGKDTAVIALNSSRPNPWPWRSNGHISQEQLTSFKILLQDDVLKERFIFIITHYAVKLPNGENDTKLHRLTNAKEFIDIANTVSKGAMLCGHVHQTYRVKTDDMQQELFCAGSATMEGREGFWIYELKEGQIKADRVYWDNGKYSIQAQ